MTFRQTRLAVRTALPWPPPDRSCYRGVLPTAFGGIHFRNLKLAGASNESRFSLAPAVMRASSLSDLTRRGIVR